MKEGGTTRLLPLLPQVDQRRRRRKRKNRRKRAVTSGAVFSFSFVTSGDRMRQEK